MGAEIGEYQRGFEWGILIGLRAAEAVLKQGGKLADVQVYVAELQDVRRRRKMEANGLRDAETADIFSEPVAHASDFGLLPSPLDDFAAAIARMKMQPNTLTPPVVG